MIFKGENKMYLDEVIAILKIIQETCNEFVECDDCPFFIQEDDECKLKTSNKLVPYQWIL